jgi:hypothetical protein
MGMFLYYLYYYFNMIIAFVRSNISVLWVIRDCMSSQQLVDFIREHIDTVSTKQFNTICPFENCKHHLRIAFGLPLAISHADAVLAICFLETK